MSWHRKFVPEAMWWHRRFVPELMMIVPAVVMTIAFVGWFSSSPYPRGGHNAPEISLSELCRWESEFMSGQASRCRAQASQGVPFDLDTEFCEMLKVCPYVIDGRDEETWDAQAKVWDRAAARSLAASRRAR